MADADSHTAAAQPPASNSPEKATLTGTLVHLWPYIWPGDRTDLKMRVVWSMVLLLAAKLATLSVPFTFKWAIDALNGMGTAPVEPSNWMLWLIASPLLMTASYGAVRVLMAGGAPGGGRVFPPRPPPAGGTPPVHPLRPPP